MRITTEAQRQAVIRRNTKHGMSKTHRTEYRSWKDMRARCYNPNNQDYHNYGGRGITVCEEWNDFATFISDMGRKPKGLTLDRINSNGNYEADNCRWADSFVQANNRRNNHPITFNGETKNLQEWCNIHGLDQSKARYRIKTGMPLEKVFGATDYRV